MSSSNINKIARFTNIFFKRANKININTYVQAFINHLMEEEYSIWDIEYLYEDAIERVKLNHLKKEASKTPSTFKAQTKAGYNKLAKLLENFIETMVKRSVSFDEIEVAFEGIFGVLKEKYKYQYEEWSEWLDAKELAERPTSEDLFFEDFENRALKEELEEEQDEHDYYNITGPYDDINSPLYGYDFENDPDYDEVKSKAQNIY